MRQNKLQKILARPVALLLAGCLLLTACGGKETVTDITQTAMEEEAVAATMHLIKTEGTVDVADKEGEAVELITNLGLYSGYGVDTRTESYAWINLDDVKLTKMDQDSEVEVKKEGKDLELAVNRGNLFFNVTEPLEEDETMTIRTSTMMVGIRGTCGWVEVSDSETMKVFLLEGKVSCEAGGKSETVQAGEMAVITVDDGITVSEFTANDIPAFVMEEMEEDDDLTAAILEDSGIDVLSDVSDNSESDTPSPDDVLPTDGDRIVFWGTINTYSYDQVLALQGIDDPNPGYHDPEFMQIIILDEPQTMVLRNGDGLGSRSGEVTMLNVTNTNEFSQYDGQHLIFSINPDDTWWPSDVSLPLGEPRTGDINVLSEN